MLARTIFGAIYHDGTVYELLVGGRWSLPNVYVIAFQMLDKIALAVILISIDIPVGIFILDPILRLSCLNKFDPLYFSKDS